MDKFKALKQATIIVDLLAQLPGEHTLPVVCDSAAEAALLTSFVRGTAGERFQSTGNGRLISVSGNPVYDNLSTVFIRCAAVHPLCGWCETLNGPHLITCEVCDEPLA